MRTFHSQDGLYFTADGDGSVSITKTDGLPAEEGGKVLFYQTVDAGTWVSVVLSMTDFSERSGDWHVFMEHHMGTRDLISA